MKKFVNLSLISFLALTMTYCNKTEDVPEAKNINIPICNFQTAVYSNDMLSFQSMEELLDVAGKVSTMSDFELAVWKSQNPGFTSLNEIYNNAVQDVEKLADYSDKIGKIDYPLMASFKEHYSESLLFNDNPEDDELYSPYLPLNNLIYGNVINNKGEVMIGGEKVNLREIEKVEDTWYYQTSYPNLLTRAKDKDEISEQTNRLYICNKGKKRKMWLEVVYYYYSNSSAILCTAKKRAIIGWSDYATQYHFNFLGWDRSSWKSEPELITQIRLYSPSGELVTRSIPSGTYIPLAEPAGVGTGKATFRAWSNGVGPMSGKLVVSVNKDNYIFRM